MVLFYVARVVIKRKFTNCVSPPPWWTVEDKESTDDDAEMRRHRHHRASFCAGSSSPPLLLCPPAPPGSSAQVVAINSSINCRLFRIGYMTPVEPPTQPHNHVEFFFIYSSLSPSFDLLRCLFWALVVSSGLRSSVAFFLRAWLSGFVCFVVREKCLLFQLCYQWLSKHTHWTHTGY